MCGECESGLWLQAFPSTNESTMFNDTTLPRLSSTIGRCLFFLHHLLAWCYLHLFLSLSPRRSCREPWTPWVIMQPRLRLNLKTSKPMIWYMMTERDQKAERYFTGRIRVAIWREMLHVFQVRYQSKSIRRILLMGAVCHSLCVHVFSFE